MSGLLTHFRGHGPLESLESVPRRRLLGQTETVNWFQRSLNANRERHFHANNRQQKLECRRKDAQLRKELANALSHSGFQVEDATKLSAWDPYDQNACAEWFDPTYMFGVDDGFDIVIGNPPYVQLQKHSGRLRRKYQNCAYSTFTSTGDIYQLFYERACRLLAKEHSTLAYITSNSWLKAEYGRSLRRYLATKHTPMFLVELGKDVFESVIVDASILLLAGGRSTDAVQSFDAIDTDRLGNKEFPPARELWGQTRLEGDAPWSILSNLEQSVLDKVRAEGTPLKDWDIAIYYGIKTGLNDAFIIDNQTKEALIVQDPKSSEILKPVVRGRDIRRYKVKWADLWLIDTHNGYGAVPAIDINDYPAVKSHLDGYYERLERRYDKGITPYNLRNCAYHGEFRRQKLFWADMAPKGRFAFSDEEAYCNNKGYIMTGRSLKYLCAVLNSSLITWWVSNRAATTGMGLTEWTIVTVERLPIPRISPDKQAPFVRLVDKILYAADSNRSEITAVEAAIDRLVCELYELTEDETKAIFGQ